MRCHQVIYQHGLTSTLRNHYRQPHATKEDDVEDVNDDDISTKIKRQVFLEELNSPKARLNYN